MATERPTGNVSTIIGTEIRRQFNGALVAVVPGLKERFERTEHAKRELEFSYTGLGGGNGTHVTEEQVRDILNAELAVLRTSFLPKSQFGYMDEKYFIDALKFHTTNGLHNAQMFMFCKADYWREIAYSQRVQELGSVTGDEAQRRANACERAKDLLSSMSVAISSPR